MFKILDDICTPTIGSEYSAGVDLYARESAIIGSGETIKIPLGVCLDYDSFPIYIKNNMKSHYLDLKPRSSLRAKGLIAGSGVIDLDYTDEIMIILHYISDDKSSLVINKGDKIAQILLKEHKTYLLGITTDKKRVGGFGSTGA